MDQAPLSMRFSRQEYWSGMPCPPPGNLPNPEIKLTSLTSPSLAGRFFTTSHLSFLRPHFFQTPKKGINSFLWKKFLSYLQVCGFAYDFNRLSFSWRRQWHPTPVFLPGKSHGWTSLVGYSPGGHWVGYDWVTSLSLFTFMHWRRKWQPTPVLLPGESQRRGSLVGCRLWGRTESDTTEVT